MERVARGFLKAQDNLADLRTWEEQQDGAKSATREGRVIRAAKTAVASYSRRSRR